MNEMQKRPSEEDLKTLHALAETPDAKALETAIREGNVALVVSLTGKNAQLLDTLAHLIATDEAELQQIQAVFPSALLEYTSDFASSKNP